jgi:hypothetical protein
MEKIGYIFPEMLEEHEIDHSFPSNSEIWECEGRILLSTLIQRKGVVTKE